VFLSDAMNEEKFLARKKIWKASFTFFDSSHKSSLALRHLEKNFNFLKN
jgi:hypothetical protein